MTFQKKESILIVNAEQLINSSLNNYLQNLDFNILLATNGRQGLDIFYERSPDIVLLDLHLPEIDGLVVLEQIMKSKKEIPPVIISGVGTMADVIQSLRLGAWDYLNKPIHDFESIKHSIEKAMEHSRTLKEKNSTKKA